MTDIDGAVSVSAPDVDNANKQQPSIDMAKPVEEEKVQDEQPEYGEKTEDSMQDAGLTEEAAQEEQSESSQPVEHPEEEAKEESEQPTSQEAQPDSSILPPDTDPSTDAPTRPDAPADNSSDSDDDIAPVVAHSPLASAPPASTTSAPRPNNSNRASTLEQQIELDDKRDREYHVPHLADFDFSTPTPSAPATPITAAPAHVPFRFDPSIIILPDSERFCAASLPLLYPKLALTLSGADVKVDVKLQALACCVDLLRSPLHVYELQAHGVLDELIVNAGAGDERLRVLATEALIWAVRQREARQYCRENGTVGRMSTLLIDHSVQVRLNATGVLIRLCTSEPQLLYEAPVSPAAGDAASVMAFLVRRVQRDGSEDVRALLLRCVLCGLQRREGLIVARYNTLLPVLAALLPVHHAPLVTAACDCIAAVAVDEVDRAELLSLQLHTALLQWLPCADVGVRRAAAGALMQATVGVAVKQAVVAAGGVEVCVQRIKGGESDEAIVCLLLELLANLMESKAGRKLVAGDEALLTAVRSRAEDKSASRNLRLSAQSALQKLTYAP